jgi:hypothetical protein
MLNKCLCLLIIFLLEKIEISYGIISMASNFDIIIDQPRLSQEKLKELFNGATQTGIYVDSVDGSYRSAIMPYFQTQCIISIKNKFETDVYTVTSFNFYGRDIKEVFQEFKSTISY